MRKITTLLTSALLGLLSGTACALQVPGPLVDTAWLDKYKSQVVILDVRSDLRNFVATYNPPQGKPGSKPLPVAFGHIPGANLVDFKKVRTDYSYKGKRLQSMLPPKESFEKLMQASGVKRDSAIVVTSEGHDNGDMTMAARLYWQIKYFGHDNVALLNGGVSQWIADGKPLSHEPSDPAPGNWIATAERGELLATSDEVAKAVADGSAQLIDNRSISLYLGTWNKGYVYAKGHIPGAKSLPNELMTEASMPSKYLPAGDLKTLAATMGIDSSKPAITYCNSGHLAAGGWFIMHELLGDKSVQLYDGSMHQWTLEGRPTKALVME